MTRWTGLVLAQAWAEGEMESRLPAYLHPVAGRPLVWHSAWSLAQLQPAPERIVVVSDNPLGAELFEDLGAPVEVLLADEAELHRMETVPHASDSGGVLVLDAAAHSPVAALQALLDGAPGNWLGCGSRACGALLDWMRLPQLFRLPEPLLAPSGVLAVQDQLPADPSGTRVGNRQQLATVTSRIRDRVVHGLMRGGVTFLLPESVLVDVDVRIGRDTVIYPGVVLEGQTTIGDETVVGPGCRIVDSWVGSGVELKGWNYVSHTSIRNRAILEPNVRRGFD